ncbi:PREDICTED: nucleolar protein 8 [Elephantulus edwardii]|uniref:nucleolar protein 8 n=1 Tax=Elephantulus edwardii TaxID=28737 RepID=UPI0003F06909|nr:PREDICTED: nucleolar protein 8 [Elephantulus edwardii]
MKRLFVGGLTKAISQADLQNQFSRFGEVSDVEIITRKDEQGNPQKIFAYINIRVAEADLNKCMSVLNKTKWKGGTLQIQQAKENFLHRLAQEREDTKAKQENSIKGNTNPLRKMEMTDLHVKAVPGTEVPGRKDWVVSKFGRILPVLHLKNHLKHKIIKYDPSKYCHNLKKIENSTKAIPVTDLTWELEGGNDPLSKKRRGEFLDFHRPKKAIKKECGEGATGSPAIPPSPSSGLGIHHLPQPQAARNILCGSIHFSESPYTPHSDHQKSKNVPFQVWDFKSARKKNSMSDDDTNSEDELRAVIAREEHLGKTTWSSIKESEGDPFVIVRDDFKSDAHKLSFLTNLNTRTSCQACNDATGNDCNCDSEDTDEIIAVKKVIARRSTKHLNTEKSLCKKAASKDRKHCEVSADCIKIQTKQRKARLGVCNEITLLSCKSPSGSGSGEVAGCVSESSASKRGRRCHPTMENCLLGDPPLTELDQLDCHDEALKESLRSDTQEASSCCPFVRTSKSHKIPVNAPRDKQCIYPEEIMASLLEGENICHQQNLKENKFQAFKGIGSLYEKESRKNSLTMGVTSDPTGKDTNSLKFEYLSRVSTGRGLSSANDSSSEFSSYCQTKKANGLFQKKTQDTQAPFGSQDNKVIYPGSSEMGSKRTPCSLWPLKYNRSLSLCADIDKIDVNEDRPHITSNVEGGSEKEGTVSHCLRSPEKSPEVSSGKDSPGWGSNKKTQESNSDFSYSVSSVSDVTKDRYFQDNQKRLAALDAKQKAKELQKKLVHNALANLDDHSEVKPTHIIFGSDSESETRETSVREQNHPEKELVKEFISKTSGKLFDSSSDEDSDSEDDNKRFKIKPQFEGRAGQKLMDLQSHFGTDHRFRMDSRFLESDSEEEQKETREKKTAEEEELAAEKKKALDIMQHVLNTTLSSSISTGSVTAKRFKDVIHYDPTRHDHTTFERKRDDKLKESKAKQQKKRAESEKLPEVSKEMYYNIATDLKERLQSTNGAGEKKKHKPWDEDCDRDRTGDRQEPASLKEEEKKPTVFTFSFFDSNAEDVKKETYRVQTVKPGKIAWQGDPCFQDSSSEEEGTVEEENHRMSNIEEVSLPQKETSRFFFFCKNDERLHAGSEVFWRGMRSNMSRNSWEARTNTLRMDCRKKHKEAKRKVKPK